MSVPNRSTHRHKSSAHATLAAAIATATERAAARGVATSGDGREIAYYPERLYGGTQSEPSNAQNNASNDAMRCQRAIENVLEKKSTGPFDPPVHLLENVATALEFMIGAGRGTKEEEEEAEMEEMWRRVNQWASRNSPPTHPHQKAESEKAATVMGTTTSSPKSYTKTTQWRKLSDRPPLLYSEKRKRMEERLQLYDESRFRLRKLEEEAKTQKSRQLRDTKKIPVTKYRTRVIDDFIGLR